MRDMLKVSQPRLLQETYEMWKYVGFELDELTVIFVRDLEGFPIDVYVSFMDREASDE